MLFLIVLQGLMSPNGSARPNPFQGGRAAMYNLIAQAQPQQQQQQPPKQEALEQWCEARPYVWH